MKKGNPPPLPHREAPAVRWSAVEYKDEGLRAPRFACRKGGANSGITEAGGGHRGGPGGIVLVLWETEPGATAS